MYAGGDLYYHLKTARKERFEEDRARLYLAQVYLGLKCLHSKRMLHRDIKPENLVIDKDGFVKVTVSMVDA